MKTDTQDQSISYKEFEVLFRNAMSRQMGTNDFIFGFMGMGMFILLIGIYIGCILAGLYSGLVIIAPVYGPAYQLIRKTLRLQNVPLYLVKPPLSKFLVTCLLLVFPGLLIFFGVRGLFSFEFCSQSALCVLIELFR